MVYNITNIINLDDMHNNNEENVEIKLTSKRGRGVFAKKKFSKDDVIESCQIIPFSSDDADKIEKTILANYWFAWKTDNNPNEYGALCLGKGSLYNHSPSPNVLVIKDYDNNLIHFIASKEIPTGSEMTIKYGTIWFKEEND